MKQKELKTNPEAVLKRGFFNRLFGRCATKKPWNPDCWSYNDREVRVNLEKTPELDEPGKGIRLERDDMPEPVLVIYGDDGEFHAFRNKCSHAGRRLDPVPGQGTVQCCSLGHGTFDYEGNALKGGDGPIKPYPVTREGDILIITLNDLE
jgi:nitrite reductase/ring-hydroxylating ferredoxin subunit